MPPTLSPVRLNDADRSERVHTKSTKQQVMTSATTNGVGSRKREAPTSAVASEEEEAERGASPTKKSSSGPLVVTSHITSGKSSAGRPFQEPFLMSPSGLTVACRPKRKGSKRLVRFDRARGFWRHRLQRIEVAQLVPLAPGRTTLPHQLHKAVRRVPLLDVLLDEASPEARRDHLLYPDVAAEEAIPWPSAVALAGRATAAVGRGRLLIPFSVSRLGVNHRSLHPWGPLDALPVTYKNRLICTTLVSRYKSHEVRCNWTFD